MSKKIANIELLNDEETLIVYDNGDEEIVDSDTIVHDSNVIDYFTAKIDEVLAKHKQETYH